MKKAKDVMLLVVSVLVFFYSVIADRFDPDDAKLTEAQAAVSLETAKDLIKRYGKVNEGKNLFYLGIVYHNIAGSGDDGYAEKALIFTKKAMEQTGLPLAAGYYGSAMTIRAGILAKNGDMMGALEKLQKGLAILDKTVEENPADMNLRLLRAQNSLGVMKGAPMDRSTRIKEDLSILAKNIETLSPGQKALYHLTAAHESLRLHDRVNALIHLKKAVKAAPKSPFAAGAKKLLHDLEL